MNNIFDYNANALSIEEQLTTILELPDEVFDTIYPQIKEELIKSYKTGELKRNFSKSLKDEDKQKLFKALEETRKMLTSEDAEEFLSDNKKDFINFLLDCSIKAINDIPYRDTVKLKVEFCNENAKIPTYANPSDAGCDVYSAEEVILHAYETRIIKTGLKVAVPDGWMLSVRPRSGMSAKSNVRVANAPGTIDSGYRDEVGIILHNTGVEEYHIRIGDRIAQFVIEPAPMIQFEIVENVDDFGENRGGGFGSTGQ